MAAGGIGRGGFGNSGYMALAARRALEFASLHLARSGIRLGGSSLWHLRRWAGTFGSVMAVGRGLRAVCSSWGIPKLHRIQKQPAADTVLCISSPARAMAAAAAQLARHSILMLGESGDCGACFSTVKSMTGAATELGEPEATRHEPTADNTRSPLCCGCAVAAPERVWVSADSAAFQPITSSTCPPFRRRCRHTRPPCTGLSATLLFAD